MYHFALKLEYINYFGETVFRHIPLYRTMTECTWWRAYFIEMITKDHGTIISTVCTSLS